jgi:hypothetical protein
VLADSDVYNPKLIFQVSALVGLASRAASKKNIREGHVFIGTLAI